MQRVLGLVDRLFGLVLGLVDHLFGLVLRVTDLLFGLTSATIGLACGFEVLVAREASDSLFGSALRLIRLCTHRAPLLLRCRTWRRARIGRQHTSHCGAGVSGLARGDSPHAPGSPAS